MCLSAIKIGIDGSRAFLDQRTGIEEYSYQVIKHLRKRLQKYEVILYVRKWNSTQIDFNIPVNWEVRQIPYVYGWTQIGLALEMLFNPVDLFFSPAHIIAVIHPPKTLVVVHGLEYEHCPEGHSIYAKWFHRFFIKKSCKWATRIVAISKNTKKDLVQTYNTLEKKISVIYNGFDNQHPQISRGRTQKMSYLFYVGRIEQRKNIIGIIEAFKLLKRKYHYDGSLLLAGGSGLGNEKIQKMIFKSEYKDKIKQLGFIDEEKKWNFLKHADVFLFPSFCEGFGIPIIEAQSVGTPVVTSNIGPMNEVAGDEDICVDPRDSEAIALKVDSLIKDNLFRSNVIEKGLENVKRFSWNNCSQKIAQEMEKCFRNRI